MTAMMDRKGGKRSYQTTASSRFRRYKGEAGSPTREVRMEQDGELEVTLRSWKRFQRVSGSDMFLNGWEHGDVLVDIVLGFTENIRALPETIDRFLLIALTDEHSEPHDPLLGLFTSALISTGIADAISLILPEAGNRLAHLGLLAQKEVHIKGDLGEFTGSLMSDGRLIIEGDVKEAVGLGFGMRGGIIVLNGNILIRPDRYGIFEDKLFHDMEGGRVIINGDVIVSPAYSENGHGEWMMPKSPRAASSSMAG